MSVKQVVMLALLPFVFSCGDDDSTPMLDASMSDTSVLPDTESGGDDVGTDAGPMPCDESPCENGGTCVPDGADFTCECPAEWSGLTCTEDPSMIHTIIVSEDDQTIDAGECEYGRFETRSNDITLATLCPDGAGGSAGPCDGPGISLAEAICAANNSAEAITIILERRDYLIQERHNDWYGWNALPPVTGTVTIVGNGASLLREELAPAFRFFFVSGEYTAGEAADMPAGELSLIDLTLRGGLAQGGDGADAADASESPGGGGGGGAGFGGAIFNEGTTTLRRVTVVENTASGGNGGRDGSIDEAAEAASAGGTGGSLAYDASTRDDGGGAGGAAGEVGLPGEFGAGGGGTGGGETNGGLWGFGGGMGSSLSNGGGAARGFGGAVFNFLGTFRVENSTFSGNETMPGCAGGDLDAFDVCGDRPSVGDGAGLYNLNGDVELVNVTMADQSASFLNSDAGIDLTSLGQRGDLNVPVSRTATLRVFQSLFASDPNPTDGGPFALQAEDSTLLGEQVVATSHDSSGDEPWEHLLRRHAPQVLLGPLADNGGLTFTHIPETVVTSEVPCRDLAGGRMTGDQRGVGRSALCAIGAFEPPAACETGCAADCVEEFCAPAAACVDCYNACNPSPCENDGVCTESGTVAFECACPAGFGGPRCATPDACERSPAAGIQETCRDAFNLGSVSDSGSTIRVGGQLPPGSDATIWYRVAAVDTPDDFCDSFHFRAVFEENRNDAYRLVVRRDSCQSTTNSGEAGRTPTGCGYTDELGDFEWSELFRATCGGRTYGQCPCWTGTPRAGLDPCSNDSAQFYIGVSRRAPFQTASCEGFEMEITNGVYDPA